MRVEAGAPSTKAYVLSSDFVGLALLPMAPDRFAVVFDAAPGVLVTTTAMSTCRLGPRILRAQVSAHRAFDAAARRPRLFPGRRG